MRPVRTVGAVLDAATLRAWIAAAQVALVRVGGTIDALNVFPVADADTGTNAALTLAGGLAALDGVSTAAVPAAPTAAHVLAAGALRAARGSSGVILGGWLAGLADGLAGTQPGRPSTASTGGDLGRLGAALRTAAQRATQAVADPWPGTLLDVAAQVARDYDPALPGAAGLAPAVDRARAGLARTSARHPVLAAAGVVDAGACALLVVLDALVAALGGPPAPDPAGWLPTAAPHAHEHATGGAFEVMLDLSAPGDPAALRAGLAAVGEAAVLVGDGDRWRAHVHTDDVPAAVRVAAAGGLVRGVVRAVHGPDRPLAVVVGCDPGLAGWFAAAGAVVVLAGAPADGLPAVLAAAPGVPVLAADGPGAALVGLPAGDPVRAAVACTALLDAPVGGGGPGAAAVTAALVRLRTVSLQVGDDLGAALDGLVAGGGEVLTVVEGPGADRDRLTAALAAHPQVEVVRLGPATCGPAWWLGVD